MLLTVHEGDADLPIVAADPLPQWTRRCAASFCRSKNDETFVAEAVRRHPGMHLHLRLDDLAVVSAGWNDGPA